MDECDSSLHVLRCRTVTGSMVMKQSFNPSETPILTALTEHSLRERVSFHVPGHKSGQIFPSDLAHWLDRALLLDQTELPGLDNLHQPNECIFMSQQHTSRYYQSDETFYSVNGSSAGIIASMLTVARGGRVLVVGNFHQSLWRGLVLADADPVFLGGTWDAVTLESVPPTEEMLRQALCDSPDVQCVFVTSPTYTGRVADVLGLVRVAHEAGIPLVVDEAHGAHFGAHPALPNHSVALGADIVIQSVHKMLPALTQTAWVHVKGNRVDRARLSDAMSTMQSTSPSYLLLASLDAAQAWLRLAGRAVIDSSLEILNSCSWTAPVAGRDPFRLWLPTGSHASSQHLMDALEAQGLFAEYSNALGVLLMFGLEVRQNHLDLLASVLQTAYACEKGHPSLQGISVRESTLISTEQRPREVEQRERRRVGIRESKGNISARMVVPYPPGVPVVYPGQRIDEDCVQMLLSLQSMGIRTLGLFEDGTVEVIR